jgi:hypothetical protein
MHSLGSISAIASEKNIFLYFPIWSCVNTMTCDGSRLGFPIGIKNRNIVEDLPMIIPGQYGFNYPSGFRDRLTLDPMGKCSNAFFSESTNMIKAKLYMNVHWMVLYKLYVFCSDMKFKMAATAGLSLTRRPTQFFSRRP